MKSSTLKTHYMQYFRYIVPEQNVYSTKSVVFCNEGNRGGSNEYPQSMFLSRNKKNNTYPCKPQFYNIKVGFKGVKII